MRVSLVITTYNWKEALGLSLESALHQTRPPEEIIVADDGSSDGTGRLIESLARKSRVPIIHSWQEDKGFRAAMARNRAIAKAIGDYVILIDGDMVLDRHFVEDHLAAARTGFFVQGSRVIVGERKTREAISRGDLTVSWFSAGIGNRKNCIRSRMLSRFFSPKSISLGGIRTCNFAFWRSDALAVNGFNEQFSGWGREDSEFAARLLNKGLRRKNLRFVGRAYHLYHGICSRNDLARNDDLLRQTIDRKLVWCEKGIQQYL